MAELKTQRLKLRRLNGNDYQNLRELESDPAVMRFTPHRFPLPDSRIQERLQSYLDLEEARAPLGIWAAELNDSGDFVGWFMLLNRHQPFAELGFMIVPRHWGKGLTTEAVDRLATYALDELKLPGLSAITDEDNLASAKVLVKSGFKFTDEYSEFDNVLGKNILLKRYELKR